MIERFTGKRTSFVQREGGDFAVVARQLRFAPARDATDLVERLRREVAAKPGLPGRVGF